jgi:hypothetical protein
MKDYSGYKRQFTQLSRAWYGKANLNNNTVDEITIGLYGEDGSTVGEFHIEWIRLGNTVSPKLIAFDDSWNALWFFLDVLEGLSKLDNLDTPPEDICNLLIKCNVEDVTKTDWKTNGL